MSSKTSNHTAGPMRCPLNLDEVDLFGEGAQEHWYDAYPILHDAAPVHRIPGEGYGPDSDGYILSKYEDISRVVKDPVRYMPTLFLSLDQFKEPDKSLDDQQFVNAMMLSMNSLRPDNTLWRAHRKELTDPWVGPGASRNEEMTRNAALGLIDKFADRARAGEVAAFVYGKGHRNEMTETQLVEQFEALKEFQAYTAEAISAKRKEPCNDMISFLTEVTYSALDRKLTDMEINGIVYAMMIGGLETTQYAIAEQAQLLCENPNTWATLDANRKLLRGFTEEGMRLRSPTQGLSTRVTTQDEVFQGVTVPKGSLLHLRWAAGNVDPEEWDCPFDLNVERKAVTRHLVFSQGPRVCPGAHLSRLEQVTAWDCLLDAFGGIRYADNNSFRHQPGIMLGTLELNLHFEKTA